MDKFIFSGHESFQCKTQWLKKGYDFVLAQNTFSDTEAVIKLGVGKNMVSAIKYWLRAFNVLENDTELSEIAHYIFNSEGGVDPFTEDIATLWVLHYHLINKNYASTYKLTFVDFHKEKKDFTKDHLQHYIKRRCFESGWNNLYNENTVKKDIAVFLQNYVHPENRVFDDFTVLLLQLNLIKQVEAKHYTFNYLNKVKIEPNIFLYAILKEKNSNSIDFDSLLEIGLMFCLTNSELIELIESLCVLYPNIIVFSDVAGIKELQFKEEIAPIDALNAHYRR